VDVARLPGIGSKAAWQSSTARLSPKHILADHFRSPNVHASRGDGDRENDLPPVVGDQRQLDGLRTLEVVAQFGFDIRLGTDVIERSDPLRAGAHKQRSGGRERGRDCPSRAPGSDSFLGKGGRAMCPACVPRGIAKRCEAPGRLG
jgi:hypothetical protein